MEVTERRQLLARRFCKHDLNLTGNGARPFKSQACSVQDSRSLLSRFLKENCVMALMPKLYLWLEVFLLSGLCLKREMKQIVSCYTCISRVYILVKTKFCWWYGIVPLLLQVCEQIPIWKRILNFRVSCLLLFFCLWFFFQWHLKTILYNSMNKNVFNWYSLSVLMSPAAWSRWILLMFY